MGTGMQSNQTNKRSFKGFSLIEVLIASGLLAIISIVVATQTSSFSKFVSKTRKSLEQDLDSVISYKVIIQDFESSYFMKLGYFKCVNSDVLLSTDTSSEVELTEANAELDLIRADYSSIAGLSSDGSTVIVHDASKLRIGDYIVLSLSEDNSYASLFIIKKVDTELNSIQLLPSSFSVKGYDCSDAFINRSVLDFYGPSIRSNVLASRVKPVKYSLVKKEVLRLEGEEKTSNHSVFQDVSLFAIKSNWKNSSDEKSKAKEGSMNFDFTVKRSSKTIVDSVSSRQGEQTLSARYVIGSANAANVYSMTGAPAATVVFPSCMVNHEFRNQIMRINPANDWWRNVSTFVLKGDISTSGVVGASITVNFQPQPGAVVSCFMHDPDKGMYPPKWPDAVNSPGEQNSVTMTQKSGGFDVFTCAARGVVEVQASMSYFDTQLNQTKIIDCTSSPIQASTQFIFEKDKTPWCEEKVPHWGIRMGTPGRVRGLDQTSTFGRFSHQWWNGCQWEGEPDAKDTGIGQSCNKHFFPDKKLKRIYLRPYRVDVWRKDGKKLFTKSEGAYVNCD